MKAYVNSSIHHLRAVNGAFAAETAQGMLVLDAGAGRAPYAALFGHTRYESADLQTVDGANRDLTYHCDLAAIPVADGRFDRVLFNQVMEHVPDPAAVLAELFRVLKPGGRLLCTAPLSFEEHEQPYDFYRYTQFGQRHLFSGAGFEVERIEWLEGYLGTLAYQLSRARKHLPLFDRRLTSRPAGLAAWPLLALLALAAGPAVFALSRLDRTVKITDRGMPLNYVVWASKPLAPGARVQQARPDGATGAEGA